jgi:hypothetical protein
MKLMYIRTFKEDIKVLKYASRYVFIKSIKHSYSTDRRIPQWISLDTHGWNPMASRRQGNAR